jgi:formylglycine-generating enzyme required for sulfatase activity
MTKTWLLVLVGVLLGVNAAAGVSGMSWVYIDDSGAGMKDSNDNPISQGGFTGYMSKYETTNAQYCEFLNAALASGDITIDGSYVKGADGSNNGEDFVGETYNNLAGSGYSYDGATNGAASRIYDSGGVFNVDVGFENHPVTYVSWYGAAAFCSYYGYRLPTEWEWQAVADYDGSYNYGCGLSINNSIANYLGSIHPGGTTDVNSFGPFGYGMCDMAGNVWDWTSTEDQNGIARVVRGGNWYSDANHAAVSFRGFAHLPGGGDFSLGFRVVRAACEFTAPEMVLIPGGEFQMGDHHDGNVPDALPVHAVYVSSFYIGKYEITNQQYCAYLNSAMSEGLVEVRSDVVYAAPGGTDPYCNTHSADSDSQIEYSGGLFWVSAKGGLVDMSNHPMVEVSWYGAAAYCDYYGYRLPTEAEWEYAGRGGEHDPYYRYPWGNSIDGSKANYSDSGDPYETGLSPWTTPVGYYDGNQIPAGTDMANGYGLYDMAGNVWEWCNDWYSATYYSASPYDNPQGPASGSRRVFRGGSWISKTLR